MNTVETLGIDTVDVPHATRQVPSWCMDQQMVVVGHQAISAYTDIPQFCGILEKVDEHLVIIGVFKYPIRTTPAIHDMIPGPFILNS